MSNSTTRWPGFAWMWWVGVSALLLLALVRCGGSDVSQTKQTASYSVKLTLDSSAIGDRTMTIEINDSAGQPVTADKVVLAPTMRSMGMASPEITAQSIGPGRYQAKPVLVSMIGDWELDVRIQAGSKNETAMFVFPITGQ